MDAAPSSSRPYLRGRLGGVVIGVLCTVWLVAVTAGFATLFDYGARPGEIAAAPARWPAGSGVRLDAVHPTLTVFLHPHCPCSRATLAELDRLMAKCGERLAVRALFYVDPALGPGWERTTLWEDAARLRGVTPVADPLGATARAFGASTSGSVVLYAADGRLLFHGGITGSRGHEGDNAGADAIQDLVAGRQPAVSSTAVYGCSLLDPQTTGTR